MMDTSERNIIQYYEILDPSGFINADGPGDSLTLDALATNSFTIKNEEAHQILYYIQDDPAEDTIKGTSLILTDNDGLELSLDNDSYEPDIVEETATSEEIFKVITMQEGQIIMTETNSLDDIEINTDESCKENSRGFREIDLDGTRAFIEESVWQLFSNKDNTDLITSNVKPKRRKKETRNSAFHCRVEGCGKFYTSAANLLVHSRSHTGQKPFSCPVLSCGKDFVTGYSLKTHLRCHSGEKPYPCMVCTKSFKTSGDLSKHMRTHTGERPFACTVPGCNKRFTTSNIRKVHLRSHTGERPYICDFENCGKSFASATNQRNHIRIHTGEKPYACKIQNCSKRFTEYSSLHKHTVVHMMQSNRSKHGLATTTATIDGQQIALEFDINNSTSFGQQQMSLILRGDNDEVESDCVSTIALQLKAEDELDGFVGDVDDYIG